MTTGRKALKSVKRIRSHKESCNVAEDKTISVLSGMKVADALLSMNGWYRVRLAKKSYSE